MKTWYKIIDNRIGDIMQSNDDSDLGSEWREIADNVLPIHSEPVDWYDPETMHRIPDDELVKMGKRRDNRGIVYNTQDRSTRQIYNFDEDLRDDETKESPIENEPYQKWDEHKNRWVVDTTKKETTELESEIEKLRGEIHSRDWKITKANRLKKDIDDLYPGETDWYNKTIAEINRLEKALEEKMSA